VFGCHRLTAPPFKILGQCSYFIGEVDLGQELFCKWIPPVFPHGTFIYDGDGKRVKSIIDTTAGTETTYFVGAHYQVVNDGTTQKIIKYYFAGSQRIAMRTNGTLNFLLGDHLGSTSLVTDANGENPIETRYTAWGEVRYSSGTMPTKYSFTGQFSYANDFGLLFFNARWVDPQLGRFVQADTIVPGGVQGLDRYAYANNSPIKYTDPTGHDPSNQCGGNSSCMGWYSEQINTLKETIKTDYGWDIQGDDWTLDELNTIYNTGQDIETYVDGLTGSKGQAWMNAYLGGTTIQHWSGPGNQTLPGWVPTVGNNTIYLQKGGYDTHWFAHELGHIWDINSGRGICACGAIGGVGDDLNKYIGGNIAKTRSSRYDNYWGKPADSHIPSGIVGGLQIIQFDPSVANGYGNGSTADYLAESFSWNVMDRQNVPIVASVWVDQAIIAQAASLP